MSPQLLLVEQIPGGFTVSEAADETRWWSVAFRGTTPSIASHLCRAVDPGSAEGRAVIAAVRMHMRAAS
jgi:hypothetical protein